MMESAEPYLTVDQLDEGKAYSVVARNFSIAIWTGKTFVGLRYKLGGSFMDHEYHWDEGPPHGTDKPIRELS
jgi:hypothetical protein